MKTIRILLAAAALSLVALPSAHAFTHPGIPLTTANLDAIKANLTTDPWKTGYQQLSTDSHASLTYVMKGPFATVSRNDNGSYLNETAWKDDMQAIFCQSLMWYFTGNTTYAQNARNILIAWATTQTAFTGVEASFDLGDYAFKYAGSADILRATWSGWTASDTSTVQNFFATVYWPLLNVPRPVMQGSQGMEQLVAALAISIFNDDTTKFNQVLSAFLADADSGLRDTLENGEVGDTGRDQGHTSLYVMQAAMMGEMFWSQGVDAFSILDNRILAMGEYYSRYNLPATAPAFISFGAPYWGLFQSIAGAPRSSNQDRTALNILKGAYTVRKGISTPWIDKYCNDQTENGTSFLFRKTGDVSTATPATVPSFPSANSFTSGLTNADLNGCTPAGSGVFTSGTWTLTGGYNGTNPYSAWLANDTVHFAYASVSGDFTLYAKVNSVTSSGTNEAKAGIMLRDSLTSATYRYWVGITPGQTYERSLRGYSFLPYSPYSDSLTSAVSQLPYWVKLERVGTRLQGFTSLDGSSWSPVGTADFDNLPSSVYVGLFETSLVTGNLSTATFSNVCLTGGGGGVAVSKPAAPYSIDASPSDSQVVLRWNPSWGATSYNVKRSTVSGGSYTTIATVSNTTYTDMSASNGTTYYYVVTAVNSAGESGNSLQDSASPSGTLVNVALGGTASASSNGSSSNNYYCAAAFNGEPGWKWYSGDNTGSTGWIQYDFGTSLTQTIKAYALTSASDVPARDPQAWSLVASNNGTTWNTLDTQSGQSFPYRQQSFTYRISNTSAYRYYRLNITASSGTNALAIGELALLTDQGKTVPTGTYRLLNRKSNKSLEVPGGATANGSSIDQWTYNGYSNQKWTLTYLGNGQYEIVGLGSGRALEVPGSSTTNGTVLDIYDWNGSNNNNQRWTIVPTGTGLFKLLNVNSALAADVNGGSTGDGASVLQWPYGNGLNQQWSFSVAP